METGAMKSTVMRRSMLSRQTGNMTYVAELLSLHRLALPI